MPEIENSQNLQYASGAILNPRLPFTDTIRRLRFGDLIIITGKIAPKSKRCTINLCNQLNDEKLEYVLHLDIRFKSNEIVRNTTIGGNWGPEEQFGGLGGLSADAHFECMVLIHTDCYKIAFNKKHFCDYRHRLPYGSVNTLSVSGEMTVTSIHVQTGPVGQVKHRDGSQPLAMPVYPGSPQKMFKTSDPEPKARDSQDIPGGYQLEMPYKTDLLEGLEDGQAIYISGVPHGSASGFTVSLRQGSTSTSDIAFNMRVIYANHTVLVNNFVNGEWGRQMEMAGSLEFPQGIHFDLILRCTPETFQVSVNNRHFVQHYHQLTDLKNVTVLEIEGDISLVHVRVH